MAVAKKNTRKRARKKLSSKKTAKKNAISFKKKKVASSAFPAKIAKANKLLSKAILLERKAVIAE